MRSTLLPSLSLSCLDVEMINKFGQLEFKYGDQERAKTLYEKLLSSYPKRTDLWSIYIDMLIKYDANPLVAARYVVWWKTPVIYSLSRLPLGPSSIESFH